MPAAAIKDTEERKQDQADILAELARAVDLEHASPEAKAAHARLSASIWTADDRARGRELGREVVATRAKELRVLWRNVAIRAFIDNYDCGQYLSRAGMVRNVHSHCAAEGYKGKGGRNIQAATISRWLTEEVEAEIRLAAIDRLLDRKGAA